MKLFGGVEGGPRNTGLNFGDDLDLNPDPGSRVPVPESRSGACCSNFSQAGYLSCRPSNSINRRQT